jgi:acetoin utilization deacetylase AcuC-like enzyme
VSSVLARLRARRRLMSRVRLWYHPEYAPAMLAESARVEGLDPRRGERILLELVEEGILRASDVRRAPIAAVGDLLRFHPLSYLESTADRERLARIFGLPPEQVDVDQLLRAQRRAVGGTLEAALAAVHLGSLCAINLGGGFHHAEPELGSGFCVYNDVGVAIAKLRAQGFDKPIAIVDLDYHQGNGNTVAYERDPSVFVFSIHGAIWTRVETQSAGKEICLTGEVGDDKYLACLRTLLPRALKELRPRLIFYIAGNDVLGRDRLGTFSLTPAGVLERDLFVLRQAEELRAPIVVTLGGGYSEQAWRSTLHLIRWVLTGDCTLSQAKRRDLRGDFSRIAREIEPLDLIGGDTGELTEEDVRAALERTPGTRLILGYYSAEGIEYALERYGILAQIRKRGWAELAVEMDPAHQLLRVRGRKRAKEPMSTLVELVANKMFVEIALESGAQRIEMLHVEWMLLEDPSKSFTLARPPLPGQKHPGLGIAIEMQELLLQAVRRLGLAGLLDNPAHYHNAFGASAEFRFLDPLVEGRFRAMVEVLDGIAVADASFAVEEGRLRFADGSACAWEPAAQVLAVEPRVIAYFASEAYRARADAAKRDAFSRGLHLTR